MKKMFFFRSFVFLFLGCFCYSETAKINTLRPCGENAQNFTFTQSGKAAAVILVSGTVSATEQKAAEELKSGLKKITGIIIEIQKETTDFNSEKPFISIGKTLEWKNSGLADKLKFIKKDGYCIWRKGANLYLFGNHIKSTYNAVIGLLEEDIGCRWYGNGYDYFPSIPNLEIFVTNRISIPTFSYRMPCTYLKDSAWFCDHNRVEPDRGGLNFVNGWFCHTYEKFYSQHDFAKHPEYFMEDATGKRIHRQLCPMNPEIQRLAIKKVREALRQNKDPNRNFINISQNDVDAYCHCPLCSAVINKYGGAPVAAHIQLVNKVAKMMKKEFPQYKAVMLSYGSTKKAPTSLKLEDNVNVWCCMSDSKSDVANLREWSKICKHLMLWGYMANFSNYFMPTPNFQKTANLLKEVSQYNVDYVFLLGKREDHGGDRINKQAWVTSKLLWNSMLDYRVLMRDFNAGVYGPAASAMDDYDELILAAGVEKKTIAEKYGLDNFIILASKIFTQGEKSLKDSNRMDLLPRLAYAQLPLDILKLDGMKENFIRTNKLDPQYSALLQRIIKLVQAKGIKHYSEPVPMKKYLSDCKFLLKSNKSEITVLPDEMTLWNGGQLVSDPLLNGQKVAKQNCDSNWSVQWPIPRAILNLKMKYQLKAKVRPEKIDNSKPLWNAGVYDKIDHKNLVHLFVKTELLSEKEYRWINIGDPFVLTNDCYFWGAANGNSNIYVEKLKLEEVK